MILLTKNCQYQPTGN